MVKVFGNSEKKGFAMRIIIFSAILLILCACSNEDTESDMKEKYLGKDSDFVASELGDPKYVSSTPGDGIQPADYVMYIWVYDDYSIWFNPDYIVIGVKKREKEE